MKPENNTNAGFCVCCGEPIPEGRAVCCICENANSTSVSRKHLKHTKGFKEKQVTTMKLRDFIREQYCISHKIKNSIGGDQQFWKREKRRLWLSLLPFFRR